LAVEPYDDDDDDDDDNNNNNNNESTTVKTPPQSHIKHGIQLFILIVSYC
jgi:hypothetical protein